MTHKDIYTKFMIEYDKAGASTSYPSLTEYEVATVLDKAYNALIAQKVTGNNYRRVAVEGDLKSIADLGPLTKSEWIKVENNNATKYNYPAPNVTACEMPEDLLYILGGSMKYGNPNTKWPTEVSRDTDYNPADGKVIERGVPVKLVNHEIAQKFFSTSSNVPWIKEPMCFIEDRAIYIVYDPLNPPVINDSYITTVDMFESVDDLMGFGLDEAVTSYGIGAYLGINKDEFHNNRQTIYRISGTAESPELDYVGPYNSSTQTNSFRITYIRRPQTFVKDLPQLPSGADLTAYVTYFDYDLSGVSTGSSDIPADTVTNFGNSGKTYKERYEFECNSTVAEELVSLAVAFALENVESLRLNSKLNMRGLEA